MDGRMIVSKQTGLRERSGGDWSGIIPLEGADVLCAGADSLFCAAQDGLIWRLNTATLMPSALFCGGPGISELCLSKNGSRLFALCSGADSLLMCCARSGQPLLLNRAGVNPQSMALDERGELLVVAGGGCEKTLVYCAETLRLLHVLDMPGVVTCAVARRGAVYSLCMDEHLASLLVTDLHGIRRIKGFRGAPGRIFAGNDCLYVSVCGELIRVAFDGDGVLGRCPAPDTARRLILRGKTRLILNGDSQSLYACSEKGVRLLDSGVRDVVYIKTDRRTE